MQSGSRTEPTWRESAQALRKIETAKIAKIFNETSCVLTVESRFFDIPPSIQRRRAKSEEEVHRTSVSAVQADAPEA